MDVDKKVAIVTGAIGNIGFTTVQYFLSNGSKYVALFDLPEVDNPVVTNRLKQLEEEFAKERFGYYKCNVANKKEFTDCHEKVLQQKEYVDILINNAGICQEQDPDLTFDVNVKAVVNGTVMAMNKMGTENREGVIVNIGSIFGIVNSPLIPVYCASKHAVVTFVRSLKEYGTKSGVRVMCICPHITATNMTNFDLIRKNIGPQISDELIKKSLTYKQKPENVASAIVDIIQRGKNGDVWLVQNDEPPFNLRCEEDINKLKIPF